MTQQGLAKLLDALRVKLVDGDALFFSSHEFVVSVDTMNSRLAEELGSRRFKLVRVAVYIYTCFVAHARYSICSSSGTIARLCFTAQR